VNIKKDTVYAATIVISVLFIIIGNNVFKAYNTESYDDIEVNKAKVILIDNIEETPGCFEDLTDKSINFSAKYLAAKKKVRLYPAFNILIICLLCRIKK